MSTDQAQLCEQLEGVFLPMFTPFEAGGAAVNEPQLRRHAQFLIESGVRILNPAGTSGEFWTLSADEHRLVLRTVLEQCTATCPESLVVAGVTGRHLSETVELACFAAEHGARVLLIAPSYYLPLSEEDLVEYYRKVAASVDAAIMLYDLPIATGVRLEGDVVGRICDACPQVIALKTALPLDSPRGFERLMRRYGQRLRIFSGMGVYFSPFVYMTGAAGITDTLGNAVPEFGLTLHQLAQDRQWEEMNRLYQQAFEVLEIEMLYGKAGLKQIGNSCGRSVGPTRYPLGDVLTAAARKDIEERLDRWSFGSGPIAH